MKRKEYMKPEATAQFLVEESLPLAGSLTVAVKDDEQAGENVEGLVKSDLIFEYEW